LTRLLTSDADESEEQTFRVARLSRRRERSSVGADEIEKWRAFQAWLKATMPPGGYEVEIPFAEAFDKALQERMKHGVTPVQLRLRRDVPAIDAAISASAVLHRAQRETDDDGRIVATLDDYRNAYDAFEPGMAALYDAKPDAALETSLVKIVEVVLEEAESIDRDKLHFVSHKIDAEQLRRRLGVSAIRTAYDRINRLSAIGAIEEDNEKRGRGRGSPRFYFIKKTSVAGLTGGVYPTVENVKSHLSPTIPAALDAQEEKPKETLGSSPASTGISEIALDAHDNPKGGRGAKVPRFLVHLVQFLKTPVTRLIRPAFPRVSPLVHLLQPK
jgi:hypothetical protein